MRNDDDVIGYVDSDYGGDLDGQKSTSGYVFCLGGSSISWRTTLQEVTALSTTEAEYIALTEGFKEVQWLRGFVGELQSAKCVPVVYGDSQSAIHLAKNSFHRRTKHIDVKYNYIRDTDASGKVLLGRFILRRIRQTCSQNHCMLERLKLLKLG